MRRVLTLALTLPALWLVPSAAHAAGTCQGQAATVESAGPTITGTEGPDVILATQAAHIDALGGDDVICAAGGTLDAGAGNDSVEIVAIGGLNLEGADLGPGVNRYVSTATAMIDSVTSGAPTEPNLDVIDTGAGPDGVTTLLPPGSHPQVRAAFLSVRAVPGDSAAWEVQLPGTVSRAGVSMGAFSGVSTLSLDLGPAAALTLHGTDGKDSARVGAGSVDADLGAGHDYLQLSRFYGAVPTRGSLDLGSGKDELSIDAAGHLDLDLRKGRSGRLRVAGVERAYLAARHVDYVGSSRNDVVYAIGCHVSLRGGPGNDLLYKAGDETAPSRPDCRQFRFHIFGQGGNDRMLGWIGRDVLIGGPGRDRADGGANIDVCRAEVLNRCDP